MARNSGASKELALQMETSRYEKLAEICGPLSSKPTKAGLELLYAALDMLLDPSPRPFLPAWMREARKKYHGDAMLPGGGEPAASSGKDVIEELQAELIIAKQQIEIERLKRELAEERLKSRQP